MRKMFLLVVLLFTLIRPSEAKNYDVDELLSLVALNTRTATQNQVTAMLGAPGKVTEHKKRVLWHYTGDLTNLIVSWNKKSDELEKFQFRSEPIESCRFDINIPHRLKSGTTDIKQAITMLGMPKDMTIKEITQELHYRYTDGILRLFFRNGVLVDFTLQGTK
jgi:hypothetical protein